MKINPPESPSTDNQIGAGENFAAVDFVLVLLVDAIIVVRT